MASFQRQQQRPKEHHFFLFRHCVRSTSFTIDLHLNDASLATNFPVDPQSYVMEPLPNWQVPEDWCTPKALEDVQLMGRRLVDSGVIMAGGDASEEGSFSNKKLQFEFISDTSHRDVDTAYALALGLKDALVTQTSETFTSSFMPAGMFDLFYAPWLFHPIEEAFCEQQFTLDELVASAQNRLDDIPSPDLFQSLATLEKVAGTGSFGNLRENIPLNLTLTSKQKDNVSISGAAQLLKEFAQIMFYSRAGKIDPPFAQQATTQDVYDLLQWVSYTRSIEDVGNAKAATNGAVLVEAMLRVLQRGFYQQRMAHTHQSNNHDDYDTRITILTGHDGNLDSMATALGVSWQPDDAYYSQKGQLVPTPPMSGIHAVRNVENGEIKIEFLYPVYDLTGASNATIFPKSVSVDFSSLSTIDPSSITLEELRAHTIEQLQRYTGATDCFKAASLFHANEEQFAESSSVVVSTAAHLVAIGAICGFLVAMLVCRGLIHQGRSNQAKHYELTGVQDTNGLELI